MVCAVFLEFRPFHLAGPGICRIVTDFNCPILHETLESFDPPFQVLFEARQSLNLLYNWIMYISAFLGLMVFTPNQRNQNISNENTKQQKTNRWTGAWGGAAAPQGTQRDSFVLSFSPSLRSWLFLLRLLLLLFLLAILAILVLLVVLATLVVLAVLALLVVLAILVVLAVLALLVVLVVLVVLALPVVLVLLFLLFL